MPPPTSLSSLLTLALIASGLTAGCARLSYDLAEATADSETVQDGAAGNTGKSGEDIGATAAGNESSTGGGGAAGDQSAGGTIASGGLGGNGVIGTTGDAIVASPDAGAGTGPGVCGDGSLDVDEECDDGAGSSTCDPDCTVAVCGDGLLNTQAGEQCDEGGETATCRADCTLVNCGNGFVDSLAGEQCDDAGESAACNSNCSASSCGDGITNSAAGEQCDDAGESASCNSNCTVSSCGDGTSNASAGEACDDSGQSASCDADCSLATCGDGTTNPSANEACDTGGQSASCNSNCTVSSCGDGIVNAAAGEACDTAGQSASCDSDCSAVSCGDGLTNSAAGEACDTGGQSASCNSNCTVAVCGDGLTNGFAGETCDTGGESASCDSDCSAVSCGDGLVNSSAGEECEPGVNSDCLGNCELAYTAFIENQFGFNESGTNFDDSQGGASGTVSGTSLSGNGVLTLSGSGQHATLSPGIVSSLTNATVEVWVTWTGSNSWERVFDFGTSDPSGPNTIARSYFAMTPKNDNGKMRVALSDGPSNADVVVELGFALPASKTHVAVVVDDDSNVMRVYVNGGLQGSAPLVIGLSAVDDLDNYLGRSQFSYDPYFSGTIHEFRIYDRALTAAQVLNSYNAGEDL